MIGRVEVLVEALRSPSASARAAWRRGWRAARPSGRPRGSRTSARPSATRCCWPPESSRGRRSSRCVDVEHLAPPPCTFVSISALRQLAHLQREGEVLVDRLLRVERVVLEHHRDVPVLGIEVVDQAVADDRCRPTVIGISPATRLSVVVLPQPEGRPARRTRRPRRSARRRSTA